MKKIKLSLVEKKLIRTLIILLVIQNLIVFLFIALYRSSKIIDFQTLKQTDITVEDTLYLPYRKNPQLYIYSNSQNYVFYSLGGYQEYNVHSLQESISKGDKLSVIYYETDSIIWGENNVIVDARTEDKIYRSLDKYYEAHKNSDIIVIIIFLVIELIFCGVVLFSIWCEYNTIKSLIRKIKKH